MAALLCTVGCFAKAETKIKCISKSKNGQCPPKKAVLSLAIYIGEPFKEMARIDQTLRICLGIQFRQRYGRITHRKI